MNQEIQAGKGPGQGGVWLYSLRELEFRWVRAGLSMEVEEKKDVHGDRNGQEAERQDGEPVRFPAHGFNAFLKFLVFLGVFLRSRGSSQTNFTFEDTLSQIGLGYTFLFVLALYSRRVQWAALAIILVVLGIIAYPVVYLVNKRRGVDISLASRELPPE